ncbi:hypothetical protein [Rummeliibacillus suwonensis]|uniref:hypothetical protein n=1 Tax=Rummeliibacillus suwonensis TaxID=1306154 RepID=UPI0011B54C1F|nr:hypothetical protein [Rummeliibacillus suwonensis]MBO2536096.1 hypothetical protein [Rummeliibacillus suwonensis]
MKDTKKAKWLVGTSAVVLSGLLLSQLDDQGTAETKTTSQNQLSSIDQSKIGKKEKELLQLDWTNFEMTNATTVEKNDRQTRRS